MSHGAVSVMCLLSAKRSPSGLLSNTEENPMSLSTESAAFTADTEDQFTLLMDTLNDVIERLTLIEEKIDNLNLNYNEGMSEYDAP
jgi:hypothetical protein